MAMTLRLNDADDAALQQLADELGVSKHEAVLKTIRERVDRTNRENEVLRLTDQAIERYGPLLDRLAQ